MYEVAAFGNPLLDIIVNIDSNDLLDKYNIKNDDQKEIDDLEMKNLYKDIDNYPKKLNPGGCAQNTVRIMQWILQKPNSTVFFGMISNDEQGNELRKLVNNDNVITKYQIDEKHLTGMCVALVSQEYRALLANISAAQYFDKTKLENDLESLQILKNTKMIYVEACFLPFRNEVTKFIQEFCVEHNKLLVFNLSAAYLVDMEPEMIRNYVDKSNILFGNQNEFKALGRLIKMDDIEKIAIDLNKNFIDVDKTGLKRFGKIIVITNGAKDIKCVYGDGVVINVDVRKAKFVVDTVSAGDAFVAGFLVGLLKGYDIEKCIDWGQTAAIEIIQQPGCTIPDYTADKIFD